MIKVVIRHSAWDHGDAESIGEILPSEVDSVVELIKNHGAFTLEGNEELVDYSYSDSRYDIDSNCFEIIVD